MSTVTAEWALWGKQAGTRDEYGILACSRGKLSGDDFAEILNRASPGTLDELPQVTLNWSGTEDRACIGIAIHEWSGQADGFDRRSALIRYFSIPFQQAASGSLTYESLYQAFRGVRLPLGSDTPISVQVQELDVPAIAGRVTQTMREAAALLLTSANVRVVDGGEVHLIDRLRFLDAVAALLPYGMRARLSASTWVSSTSAERIRLSFAKLAPSGAHQVSYSRPSGLGHDTGLARGYFDRIAAYPDQITLINRLAQATGPLSFKEGARPALELLDSLSRASIPIIYEHAPVGATDLLRQLADRSADLWSVLTKLGDLAESRDHAMAEFGKHQQIIREHGLLTPKRDLEPLEEKYYDVLLTVGYGGRLEAGDLDLVLRDAGIPTADPLKAPRPLIAALMRLRHRHPTATLRLAQVYDEEQRRHILSPLPVRSLVEAAAETPYDLEVIQTVCAELELRSDGESESAEIAAALRDDGYLVTAIEATAPSRAPYQYTLFQRLLRAAYGPSFEPKAFEEVVVDPPTPRSVPLLAAAVSLYGGGAGKALVEAHTRAFLRSGLDHKTVAMLAEHLAEQRPGSPQELAPSYAHAPEQGGIWLTRWWHGLRQPPDPAPNFRAVPPNPSILGFFIKFAAVLTVLGLVLYVVANMLVNP